MALFRMAFFRLFALVFRHFAWRISFFRLFAWRYFVFSLFRLAFFRYFVFSLGVISSWRRAITPGEKTKERNNEMAQTSHHRIHILFHIQMGPSVDITPLGDPWGGYSDLFFIRRLGPRIYRSRPQKYQEFQAPQINILHTPQKCSFFSENQKIYCNSKF